MKKHLLSTSKSAGERSCAFLELDNSPGAGHLIAGGNWNPFSAVSLAPGAVPTAMRHFGCSVDNY